MLEFQATRIGSAICGVTPREVEEAFPHWDLVSVDTAETRGLGWPMGRTAAQWYRFAVRAERKIDRLPCGIY